MSLSSGRTSGFAEIPSSLSGGLVLAAFLVLGSYLRLADVGTALLFGDELHSLRDMHGGYGQILGHFSQTGGGLQEHSYRPIICGRFSFLNGV